MDRLRRRLGVGIGRDEVRAVLLDGRSISWVGTERRQEGESLRACVLRLLATVPLRAWPRPRVVAAVGPSLAQTKLLTDLPPVSSAKVLSRLVAEGSGRFFLRNGAPLVTSRVRITEPGEAWAAAFDEQLVVELEAACRDARLTLHAVVPAVVVLAGTLQETTVRWEDGGIAAEVSYNEGRLLSVRRAACVARAAAGDEPQSPRVASALAGLGDGGWRFAGAYGAALLSPREPLALRLRGRESVRERPPRWRVALAAASLVLVAAAGTVASTLAAAGASKDAVRRLDALATRRRGASLLEGELAATTSALSELARFDASRRSLTQLLAKLTDVLPTESSLVTFRWDTAGGSVIALAARAGAVVASLERVPGIVSPEIFGPVTREVVAGRELERVTIRFRLAQKEGVR